MAAIESLIVMKGLFFPFLYLATRQFTYWESFLPRLKIAALTEPIITRHGMSAGSECPELERYRIQSLPCGLYYISQFLSPEEENSLLDKVVCRVP